MKMEMMVKLYNFMSDDEESDEFCGDLMSFIYDLLITSTFILIWIYVFSVINSMNFMVFYDIF